MELLAKLSAHPIRVDIDDRDEPLGKKIRDGQMDWVPYILVVGDKEMQSGKATLNIRATDEKKEASIEDIVSILAKDNAHMPFEKNSLPQELSKRPVI